MDGLRSNALYLSKLLEKSDIVCIQEHWLHRHEADDLAEYCPDHNFVIKCFDDADFMPLRVRSRGWHGTATIWKRSLDDAISPIEEGSDRVIAVIVGNMILINTYMPSQGAANANYAEVLDEVHVLLTKYSQYTPIWTGDLNASPVRNLSDNDIDFIQFCHEHGLQVSKHTPRVDTFYHNNGSGATSQIDHFVELRADQIIHSIQVLTRDPVNTSTHDPVMATVTVATPTHKTSVSTQAQARRIKWDKVDKALYRESTGIKLKALRDNMEGSPASVIAERINVILAACAADACPQPSAKSKRRKSKWTDEMKPLAKEVNHHYRQMKKCKLSDCAYEAHRHKLKTAQKLLRRAQRHLAAKRRQHINEAIIESCQRKDKRDFFKTIKKQRQGRQLVTTPEFGEHSSDNPANSWARYFEELATPKDDPSFDQEHNRYLQINFLLQSLSAQGETLPQVHHQDIIKLVSKLKSGKAPDIYGIASEHIKLAHPVIIDVLVYIVNHSISAGKLPKSFKLGSVCPIRKKNKNPKKPTNYRRITITAIVGKILELHMVQHSRPILDKLQSRLQFGFTSGCSPVYAALVLTEVMSEAKDSGEELLVALLDTSKAFDVVSHTGMLNAMYSQGIHGNLWQLFCDMYHGNQSVVKWQGDASEPFSELQGIKQGGSSSTDSYKAGKNNLLDRLESRPSNMIGSLPVGAVMVADDLSISAKDATQLQCDINVAARDASREGYMFNVEKTKIIPVNCSKPAEVFLNGKLVGTSQQEAHLGIIRNSEADNSSTVADRIQAGRRTAYSLMSAGFHSLNGAGPEVTLVQYNTYVIPTMLYGLEALVLTKPEVEVLDAFHRKCLRYILHLPQSTTNAALYLLLGTLPMQAQIDIRTLNLFRDTIAAESNCPPALYIRNLVVRQLGMRDLDSSRWSIYVAKKLVQYSLPTALDIVQNPPKKKK